MLICYIDILNEQNILVHWIWRDFTFFLESVSEAILIAPNAKKKGIGQPKHGFFIRGIARLTSNNQM